MPVPDPLETVSVGYRAYHPKPDVPPPGFVLRHSLILKRGLSGPSWNIAITTVVNVGGPGASPPHQSQTKTFGEPLGPPTDLLTMCACSPMLHVVTMTTNGEGHSNFPRPTYQAAFATEVL